MPPSLVTFLAEQESNITALPSLQEWIPSYNVAQCLAGGAPRSESQILMIASGNHTMPRRGGEGKTPSPSAYADSFPRGRAKLSKLMAFVFSSSGENEGGKV